MRIDHFAYQRATRIAGFGLVLQLVLVGIPLLLFAVLTGTDGDTAIRFGAYYVLCGVPVWLSLVVLLYQHKLERLEALEHDELSVGRDSSMFSEHDDEIRVAARRLRRMHQWMMPIVSLVVAAIMGLVAWRMLAFMAAQDATGEAAEDVGVFTMTPALGWAVAICLSFAAICFIFSRFVAGMAKQKAWQNLRGGAGFMVGNALVTLAIAIGVIFRFFQKDQVIEGIALAIPIFMLIQAAEIALNFVLNLYRPRIPGEVPRPAFDSRVLSILAAPDSLVRSINEAVNYQFGFDVTSTWGYQLLMRSIVKLLVLAIVVLVVLSTMVVVEPHQQAVRLRRGDIVGDVYGSGLMLKLPWPLESASIHDVMRIRELPVTARRTSVGSVAVWQQKLEGETDRAIEPFIVRASNWATADATLAIESAVGGDTETSARALVHVEIVLQYRIRSENDGLLDYLRFAPDTTSRWEQLSVRERALPALALREANTLLSAMTMDEILARDRLRVGVDLKQRIQAAFDAQRTGVELITVTVPLVRPAGESLLKYEDLTLATQDIEQYVALAERGRLSGLAYMVGDAGAAEGVVADIESFNELRSGRSADDPEVVELRDRIERQLVELGGEAGQMITQAYTDRWGRILSARAEAARVSGQLAGYLAAPELYRQRETMRVLRNNVAQQYKYFIGTDPARVALDVEFQKLSTSLDFSIAQSKEAAGEGDSQ